MGVIDRGDGLEELFGLADDLEDLIQLVEAEGRDDSQPIWGDSTTEDVVNLVKELFQKLEENLELASKKINGAEKEELEKVKTKTQEVLRDFGKER